MVIITVVVGGNLKNYILKTMSQYCNFNLLNTKFLKNIIPILNICLHLKYSFILSYPEPNWYTFQKTKGK